MSERGTRGRVWIFAAMVLVVLGAIGVGLYYDSQRNDAASDGAVSTYTPPPSAATGPRAVFIGDSFTSGAGASDLGERWTTRLANALSWRETNLGIGWSGYLTESPDCANNPCGNYQSVVPEAVQVNPNVVVVAGGLNDFVAFTENPGPVVDAIYATFGALRTGLPDARIVAVGPSAGAEVAPFVVAFDGVVQDAAKAVGAEYVSLINPVDVVGDDMLDPDGIHPNDKGHAAIADAVAAGVG